MSQIEMIQIRKNFYRMEFDVVRCFMFVGQDRVVLVDAGFPGRGLMSKIREVTDLPIEVIYSHTDGDHIGDIGLFDRPFIHPAEVDYLRGTYGEALDLRPLWEGQKISIGDYLLEVVLLPGHTPGSIGLLDRQHRFMLTGDTVHFGPVHMFGPGRNLQAYLFSLKKLKTLVGDIDTFYTCHHQLEASPLVLDDLTRGVEGMLKGDLDGPTETMKGQKVKRYIFGQASFYA